MARKYTKVEQLTSIIEERVKAGETYREIGTALGLTREEVRGAMHRKHAKERKMARSGRNRGKPLFSRLAHPRRRAGLGRRTETETYICCPRS